MNQDRDFAETELQRMCTAYGELLQRYASLRERYRVLRQQLRRSMRTVVVRHTWHVEGAPWGLCWLARRMECSLNQREAQRVRRVYA